MNKKDLKNLSRGELLEIILSQLERIESLEKELKLANKNLNSKKIILSEAGNIAEASLKLSGIFEKAQEAVSLYQDNIDLLNKSIEEEITKKYEKEKDRKMKQVDKLCENKKKDADLYVKAAREVVKELTKNDKDILRKVRNKNSSYKKSSK